MLRRVLFRYTRLPINLHSDIGGVMWMAQHVRDLPEQELPSVWQNLSSFSPITAYQSLDQFSRDFLFELANNYGLGVGSSIILISLGIKLLFSPFIMMAQRSSLKMKQLEPEMAYYRDLIRRHQLSGNIKAMKQANQEFMGIRERHGFKTWPTFMVMSQFPILITWFLSMRYVCSFPQMFPEITLPFLYLEALNQPDPYYLLPVSFAYLTYLNIALSPNSGSSLTPPVIKLFMKYLRYIPFFSLPVVCFFPSGICLYWFCNSASQLALLLLFKTSFFKNLMLPPIKVQHIDTPTIVKLELKKPQVVVPPIAKTETQPKQSEDKQKAKTETKADPQSDAKSDAEAKTPKLISEGVTKIYASKPKKQVKK